MNNNILYCLLNENNNKYISGIEVNLCLCQRLVISGIVISGLVPLLSFSYDNNIKNLLLFRDKESAESFIDFETCQFCNVATATFSPLKIAEISTGMKLSELKILNNIIPLEIATDREVNACEEYFKSNGSHFSDFYVSLLMNEENLEKTRLTIKETANRGSVYLRYYYYPCELFYKMNKKKEEK